MIPGNPTDPVERDQFVRAVLEQTGNLDVLLHIQPRVRAVRTLLRPPLRLADPNEPIDSQIKVSEVTINVGWGSDMQVLLDASDQDLNKLIKAHAERVSSGIARSMDAVLGVHTVADPNMAQYGAPPAVSMVGLPPSQWSFDRMLHEAGCDARGCRVSTRSSLMDMDWVIHHTSPDGAMAELSISFSELANNSDGHHVHRFMEWTYQLHGGKLLSTTRITYCPLCGQERDVNAEPVELELPPGGPNPNYRYAEHGTIEACSRECATAYAMRIDMAREHTPVTDLKRRPDLRREHEEYERRIHALHRERGELVTDSEPRLWPSDPGDPRNMRRLSIGLWNPWADQPDRAAG